MIFCISSKCFVCSSISLLCFAALFSISSLCLSSSSSIFSSVDLRSASPSTLDASRTSAILFSASSSSLCLSSSSSSFLFFSDLCFSSNSSAPASAPLAAARATLFDVSLCSSLSLSLTLPVAASKSSRCCSVIFVLESRSSSCALSITLCTPVSASFSSARLALPSSSLSPWIFLRAVRRRCCCAHFLAIGRPSDLDCCNCTIALFRFKSSFWTTIAMRISSISIALFARSSSLSLLAKASAASFASSRALSADFA